MWDGMKNSDAERFNKHFKVSKKEINQIRKDYSIAKEATELLKTKTDPESLKCFEDLAKQVFDFFEEITGKSVNRAIMVPHISYYLDEGFGTEEMCAYIRGELTSDWYKQNPTMFTIARLFPIKDQDRITITWDLIAHHLAIRTKTSTLKSPLGGKLISLYCGHSMDIKASYCIPCIEAGTLEEIARNPYANEIPEVWREFASFFKRQNEESPESYMNRTMPEFKILIRSRQLRDADKREAR